MNIQSLEVFIKMAEVLHFGRASRACNMSPSALTRTIQRLEEEVGQPLFLRDNRTVILTDTGKQMVRYARNAILEWNHFKETVVLEHPMAGMLSIYASVTAVYSLLPKLLESYRAVYPQVQLDLRTGAAEDAVEQVLRGEIDLAVAAFPDQKLQQLEFLPLTQTPLVFIVQKGKEVPMFGKIPADYSSIPWVVPSTGTARKRLDAWFRQNRITPHIATEVSGNEALIAMVRLGIGVGIVPQLALERSPIRNEIRVLKNAPKLDPYVVGLCTSKRNLKRPAIQALWQLAAGLE